MKKLCFIVYNNIKVIGGVNSVVLGLCDELRGEYDVSIISICSSQSENDVKLDGVKFFELNEDINNRLSVVALRSFLKLKKILKKEKFDIIFMEGHYTPAVVLLSSFLLKSKIVFCDHGSLLNQIKDKKIVFLRKIASKFSSKTVVLTKKNHDDYCDLLKINPDRIVNIYNFCNEKFYEHSGNYNIESKKILSVGRLSNEKGFDLALKVAKRVLDKYKNWEWHVYGDGPERKSLEEKIQKYNLKNKFILKGNIDKTYTIYNEYSIFVMPSYREGLSLVLIEAQINKLPCVSFDCIAGPNEIVLNGVNGFLISCYNIIDMSDKIRVLIENKDIRKKFSENSHNNLEKFKKVNIMKKWRNLIEELI